MGPSAQQDRAAVIGEPGRLLALYRDMVRVREFEEQVQMSYLKGLVHGTTHLCQGQEAVCVGVLAALRPDDYLTYTYRGHGVCIARGMAMEAAFAEIFGRETGVSRGLGGSMHLTDPDLNLIGSFGIVGAGLPAAVGAALSAQLDGKGQVSATFFGDGSTNIGAFHESLNIAAVWKLPALFVCENNLYGEFSRINHTTPYESLKPRGAAYGVASVSVDGNDVLAVLDAAKTAVARARAGDGPTFLECLTYRHRGHSRTDPAKYRDPAEVEAWLKRDPVLLFAAHLKSLGRLDDADIERIAAEAKEEAAVAAGRAAASPWPAFRDFSAETLAP